MAGKRRSQEPPSLPPSINSDVGIGLLRSRIEKAQDLLNKGLLSSNDHQVWENTTRDILVRAFGSESKNINDVLGRPHLGSYPMNASESWWNQKRLQILGDQINLLKGCIEQLEIEIAVSGEQTVSVSETKHTAAKTVFIVHGRDDGRKAEVARLLQKLKIDALILHEQPNAGKTLIEKFEAHAAEAQFAVVLMTADDTGGLKGSASADFKPRARQNVVLELGYFFGKLGRGRVCALYESGVELPSDIHGISFVPLDGGSSWHFGLAKELKAAGFKFDTDALL